jgi:uncharacterized membrane protein YadS
LGRLLGLPLAEACVAAGAVSICGGAAAMAVSQVLPSSRALAKRTGLVVVAVNLLSTLAMLAYPLLARALGLDAGQTGVFFGLAIHDVAQAVGAGASVSPQVAHIAALAKLGRVLWLAPAVILVGALAGGRAPSGAKERTLFRPPLFLLGFLVAVALRNFEVLPAAWLGALTGASRLLLLGGAFGVTAVLPARAVFQIPPRLLVHMTVLTLLIGGLGLCAARVLAR